MALIALSLFAAFGFTVTFTRRVETEIDEVQRARAGLIFLARELSEASAGDGGVVLWSRGEDDAHDAVGFLSARTDGPGRGFVIDPGGTPNWQVAVVYLVDHTYQLQRVTMRSSPLALPASAEGGQIVAKHVRRFRVRRDGDVVAITLVVAPDPKNPSATTTLETAVRPRN
jgi:hypothetical protein